MHPYDIIEIFLSLITLESRFAQAQNPPFKAQYHVLYNSMTLYFTCKFIRGIRIFIRINSIGILMQTKSTLIEVGADIFNVNYTKFRL
jgi:hypothetical protein